MLVLRVPAFSLFLSDPIVVASFILLHTIAIVLLAYCIKRRMAKKVSRREVVLTLFMAVLLIVIAYITSGIVNNFYDSIVLSNESITLKVWCVVPLKVSVNFDKIEKVLIVPIDDPSYRLTLRTFGIGSVNYLAGYFESHKYGRVFVLMVEPRKSKCLIIFVLKKCENVCALYVVPPPSEYQEFVHALSKLSLKILNECKVAS